MHVCVLVFACVSVSSQVSLSLFHSLSPSFPDAAAAAAQAAAARLQQPGPMQPMQSSISSREAAVV